MRHMFEHYEKERDGSRVLMVYLILNDWHKNVESLEEIEENRAFGLRLKKVYGLTKDHIDTAKIYREIEAIENPVICSDASYEYYADSPFIYTYKPKDQSQPLVINDMSVISKTMVVADNYVVSDNKARSFMEANVLCGFTHFMQYVLYNQFRLDKWDVSYEDNVFTICYDGEELYSAFEIDKTSTYKLVIYLIRKAGDKANVKSDNFVCERYTRKAIS